MKLQPKKAVSAEVATQRKTQIDEGVKLASKVDVLRETLVKEEGNLARFRQETVKSVQAEVDTLLRVRDGLKGEITGLERLRETERVPLDAEWRAVEQAKRALSEKEVRHLQVSTNLDDREEDIAKRDRTLKVEEDKAVEINRQASENFVKSEKSLESANKEATQVRQNAQTVLSSAELQEKVVDEKEANVLEREAKLATWEAKLVKFDQDLTGREKLLRDNYKTLERAKQEIHGRRINRRK